MSDAPLAAAFLGDLAAEDEDEAARLVVEDLDRVLGHPTRRHLAAGTELTREGEAVDGIHLVLEGTVQLVRGAGDEEVLHHAATTGRIVGLSAVTLGRVALFTARAVTDVTVVFVPLDRLEPTLRAEPGLSSRFIGVLLRSQARRHRRAAELQDEVERLNRSLTAERDQLAQALDALAQAQAQLVDAARMATLGELAAGIAHELNNPVTAIVRAADFVADDLRTLLADLGDPSTGALDAALTAPALPTAEHRRRRRALTEALGQRALAERLLAAGVDDPARATALVAAHRGAALDDRLADLERHHRLGVAVRNLRSGGERIAELVAALRSYARPDHQAPVATDVHQGLEDTLRLLGHRLTGVEVRRRYGDLPEVAGVPAQLNQVWTNLVANAADALDHHGTLELHTDAEAPGRVRVQVLDDGPGIPPEVHARLFEPRFTTKDGRVRFGLGMGLAISRQIVDRHGGTIDVTSEPGRTCVTVVLPTTAPEGPEEVQP